MAEKARRLQDSGQTSLFVGKGRKPSARAPDRRVTRTLSALLKAFIDLLLERSYGSVSVADIVERAGVGRSTFYDHFRNKDEILIASMGWMFSILADSVRPAAPRAPVDALVAHFWSNRGLARAIMAPPTERKLRRALTAAVDEALASSSSLDPVARKLAAVRIAAGQLGLLEAWTRGEVTAAADQVAEAIVAIARA